MSDNNARTTLEELDLDQFVKLPKFLFTTEYEHLSSDAIILYSLLKDRESLSKKNEWYNDRNEVFLIYTRNEMAFMLSKSVNTARKAFKQLVECNLVDEERQGINKPNLIYILAPKPLLMGTLKNYQSRSANIEHQDTQKLPCNKTEINHTDTNKTDNKIITTPAEVGVCNRASNLLDSDNYEESLLDHPQRNAELTEVYLKIYKVVFGKNHRVVKKNIKWWMRLSEFDNSDIEELFTSYMVQIKDNAKHCTVDYASKFVDWDRVDGTHRINSFDHDWNTDASDC